MRRALPWIALISGLLLGGYGAAYVAAADAMPEALTEPSAVGGVTIGIGLLLLISSLGSLSSQKEPEAPAPTPAAPAPAPAPRPASNFPWSATVAPQAEPGAEALEDVRRRIAQLKVRYGLGEMSPEAYRRLMGDLEAEEANLERSRRNG